MDIRDEHMKTRCLFMWAMCGMSLYNYYQHQPYENIYFLFLLYDAYLLKQLHKNLTMKKTV
jgi:hypothetical protein